MKKNVKIELLSPAGSLECEKEALRAGADAIYMGGAKFGARAFAKSVEENSIIDAIGMAHENNKRFYITVNTLFKQKELKEIFLFLDPIVEVGVDAFILQDLGVSMILKNRYFDSRYIKRPELHASTQMTIASSKGINFVKKLGFSQVVLARELSIKEIKKIKKEVGDDIRLEAFVHGSMCYCYSGACLMSSFIGGESGNRGRCKGPCRLQYRSSKNVGNYLLSMKDMCALNKLEELIDAGVTSFKIEGRMRQEDYVYGVTKTYRKYIDLIMANDNLEFYNDKIESIDKNVVNKNNIIKECDIEKDESYLLSLYNKGGFTNYYDKHNSYDMIQRYEH